MQVIEFSRNFAQPIELFGSISASSVRLADGHGEAKGSEHGMTALMVQVSTLQPPDVTNDA